MKEMIIESIYWYPVKSLLGIEVESKEYHLSGFVHDRRFVLIDQVGKMVTQRETDGMHEFALIAETHHLVINHPNSGSVQLAWEQWPGEIEEVAIWKRQEFGVAATPQVNNFFSDSLGKKVRLFQQVTLKPRDAGFRDTQPLLIINKTSIKILEDDLGIKINHLRFRPNIVITASKAFEEFDWRTVKIGEDSFKATRPCARCVVINRDPETGEKSLNLLQALTPYTLRGQKILFGMYFEPIESQGFIKKNSSFKIG
ncbi:MAG TPA: MOSC domain-containing protein [Saprospiraceae bacterium]|nr:MOSC domain-containing protein [Saprospiraceae bacterium]HQW56638.1 MOSC domain-containing protein [Saprospiraceae bacterium]